MPSKIMLQELFYQSQSTGEQQEPAPPLQPPPGPCAFALGGGWGKARQEVTEFATSGSGWAGRKSFSSKDVPGGLLMAFWWPKETK